MSNILLVAWPVVDVEANHMTDVSLKVSPVAVPLTVLVWITVVAGAVAVVVTVTVCPAPAAWVTVWVGPATVWVTVVVSPPQAVTKTAMMATTQTIASSVASLLVFMKLSSLLSFTDHISDRLSKPFSAGG